MKERTPWLDTLKGLGIVLVVLGHSGVSDQLRHYIFSFHMPLFFFVSGYLFVPQKYGSLDSLIRHKIKSLLMPYLWFSIISIAVFIVLSYMGSAQEVFNISGLLKEFILAERNFIIYNSALWFLPSLFLTEIVFYIIHKLAKHRLTILGFSLLAWVIGYFLLEIPLPWSFNFSLFYTVYFGIGYVVKGYKLNPIISFVCLILNIFLPHTTTSLAYSIFIAFVGITAYIGVSQFIAKEKFLQYLGRNSITILALHMPIGFTIVRKVLYISKVHLSNPDLIGITVTLGTLVILIPCIYFINTYTPFIVGKTKKPRGEVDSNFGSVS